jgi:hypothetical protein
VYDGGEETEPPLAQNPDAGAIAVCISESRSGSSARGVVIKKWSERERLGRRTRSAG